MWILLEVWDESINNPTESVIPHAKYEVEKEQVEHSEQQGSQA